MNWRDLVVERWPSWAPAADDWWSRERGPAWDWTRARRGIRYTGLAGLQLAHELRAQGAALVGAWGVIGPWTALGGDGRPVPYDRALWDPRLRLSIRDRPGPTAAGCIVIGVFRLSGEAALARWEASPAYDGDLFLAPLTQAEAVVEMAIALARDEGGSFYRALKSSPI